MSITFESVMDLTTSVAESMTEEQSLITSSNPTTTSKGLSFILKTKRTRSVHEEGARGSAGLHKMTIIVAYDMTCTGSSSVKVVDENTGEVGEETHEFAATASLDEVEEHISTWRAQVFEVESRVKKELASAKRAARTSLGGSTSSAPAPKQTTAKKTAAKKAAQPAAPPTRFVHPALAHDDPRMAWNYSARKYDLPKLKTSSKRSTIIPPILMPTSRCEGGGMLRVNACREA